MTAYFSRAAEPNEPMNRRQFIRNTSWAASGLMAGSLNWIPGKIFSAETISQSFDTTSVRDTLLLRSAIGHGGNSSWMKLKAMDAPAGGAEISSTQFQMKDWSKAIVPGTVLNSLVNDDIYPEPYFGLNNAHEQKFVPDLHDAGLDFYTYWFRTEFALPDAFHGRQVWLQLDGVNYRAEVWLNGQLIGDLTGMFRRGIFNVTDAAKFEGPNALAILVKPVDVPGGFKQKGKTVRATGENRNGGDGEIGRNTTMLMTVGWDFTFTDGIRDRNTGIWRDIKLFATGPVALQNPFVKTKLPLPDLSSARVEISIDVTNFTAQSQAGILKIIVPEANIEIKKEVSLNAGETKTVTLTPEEFAELNVKTPRLWWPLNKGEQFLYNLHLEFIQDEKISDNLQTRFGIREITSDCNTPDQSRQFFVNGRRFFAHGSNWIPEAMCRTSEARTYAELRYTKQAGINFLRLWGGGIAESDYFFDLCDEFGILVWMEFWQTGDTKLPEDHELYRANVADTILRIRNHPSLAYYCSANERPGWPDANVDPSLIVPIKDIVEKLDPMRGWQQSSEVNGIHDGSPYVAVNPMWYYEDTASIRGSRINGFCPEYGCPILPTVDCLREMMSEKDLWPINKQVWDYLDGGGFHGMTGDYKKCVEQYGESSDIESYSWKAQAFGALAFRSIWECWNYNKFNYGDRFCTGLFSGITTAPTARSADVCGIGRSNRRPRFISLKMRINHCTPNLIFSKTRCR